MCVPKLRIGNIDNTTPELRLGEVFLPCTEMLAIKCRELGRHPGFRMDPVCDVGDRHFMDWNASPNIFTTRSGDFAVQFANPIGMAAKTQCEDGHTERIVWINARVTEREQLVERNVQF